MRKRRKCRPIRTHWLLNPNLIHPTYTDPAMTKLVEETRAKIQADPKKWVAETIANRWQWEC